MAYLSILLVYCKKYLFAARSGLRLTGVLAALLLTSGGVLASGQALDVGLLADKSVTLTKHFGVLEDPAGKLEIADVASASALQAFKTGQANAWSLNYGLTQSAYWLKLDLKNTGFNRFDGMLEFTYPRLASSVQVYQATSAGGYSVVDTGYMKPFSTRAYPHHFYVFPLSMEPHSQTTIYMRFRSDVNLEIPGRLWQRDAFHRYERVDYGSNALYFGLAFAMVVYNFLLFLSLRSSRYLLYVCFGISSTLSIAAISGLAIEYLWGNSPYWSNIAASVGYSTSLALGLMFMRSMIGTAKLVPRLDWALQAGVAIHLVLAFGVATHYTLFIKPQLVIAALTALLVIVTGAICALRRDRSALYFTAAFAVMTTGAVANSLRALGLIPTTFFSTYGIQIGSTIEMLLLAFALADQYHVIRREKELAQKQALLAQKLMVESLQSSERELESRVKERTGELKLLNARLETLSATDGLTGLANRRHFDEVLDTEWRRSLRSGQSIAVGILDVDWFKKYNDHYGHLSGDDCLKHVAKVLATHFPRAGDLVARYGGEEFAFIMCGTEGTHALTMSQRLCRALEETDWKHAQSSFGHITASVGVASVIPRENTSPLALLKAGDEALYLAKAQGRNRAVLANWPGETEIPSPPLTTVA
jgi:diguanylate cyclase (GGDEF)-like protein